MATEKVLIDVELLKQIEQSLGSFCSDQGWSDADMSVLDNVSATLASGIKTVAPDAGIDESVAVIRQIMRFIREHSPKGFCPSLAEQRVNARLDMIVSATAQQPHTVKLPTTADEAEISQREAECLRCAVWGCTPGTFPPEQPRDDNIQRVPVAYRIRTIDGKGGYSGWRYFTGRYNAPLGMQVELLYNEDGSGCKYPMCSCSVNLHTMGGCVRGVQRPIEQDFTTLKAAIANAQPVAWRDPSNADPAQGCTYEKAKHDKWPHIYRQPLYTLEGIK